MSGPVVTIGARRYREEPAPYWPRCSGCAFDDETVVGCANANNATRAAFGGDCNEREVIYVEEARA